MFYAYDVFPNYDVIYKTKMATTRNSLGCGGTSRYFDGIGGVNSNKDTIIVMLATTLMFTICLGLNLDLVIASNL